MPHNFTDRADISDTELKELIDSIPKWISIKDNYPSHAGQEILFCSTDENFLPATFGIYLGDKFKSNRFYSYDNKSYNATHWMPLPENPK